MTVIAEMADQKTESPLFIDDLRGKLFWYARWYDDAGNAIRRQLIAADVDEDGEPTYADEARAVSEASAAWHKHQENFEAQLAQRAACTSEQLEEFAQSADFPRRVVARHIETICEMIGRDSVISPIQSMAERAGVTIREVHRILDDPEKVYVGAAIVDRICCEFDVLYTEMIEESFAWANRTGHWSDRPGSQAPWPFGYFTPSDAPDDDLI